MLMAGARERVLIDQDRISIRVREIADRMLQDLPGATGGHAEEGDAVVMIPVLTGALVFTADLIRCMPIAMSVKPITIHSYPGKATTSQGASLRDPVPAGLEGRHVVVVDDILDSGATLALIRARILEQRPASLRICVLLRKLKERQSEVEADYAGFDIPDEFVVGYGLDYDGLYRNLPDIRVLEGVG